MRVKCKIDNVYSANAKTLVTDWLRIFIRLLQSVRFRPLF